MEKVKENKQKDKKEENIETVSEESKKNKENKTIKENKEIKIDKKSKESKENKKDKKKKEIKENKQSKKNKEIKENKQSKKNKEIKENKQGKKNKEIKENKQDKKNREIEENKQDKKDKEIEENKQDKKKKEKNEKHKILKRILISVIILICIFALIVVGYLIYHHMNKKYKDITIEIGTVEQIVASNFLVSQLDENEAVLITDLSQIDLDKVGEYEIELQYKDETQKVKLFLVDTTAPKVVFQDVCKYIDYQINPEDFVKEKEDLSEMTIEMGNVPEITAYGDYKVIIIVKDASGNITSQECNIKIEWIKPEYTLELGNTLTKEDLLYNVEIDGDKLPQEELDRINNSPIGEYEIKVTNEGQEYTVKITIQDTTPPELELKDVSIYDDETVKGKGSFIVSSKDASGEVTTTLKTQINYGNIGTQDIVIEAVDKNGNKTEKTAKLTIKKDTTGPAFSGLSTITIAKNAKIDYNKGVKAVDAKDGAQTFSVNSGSVNVAAAGTYYATYTSKDTKGNTTTEKRKVVVKHDSADVRAKVKEEAKKCGNSLEEIRDYVREKIRYSHEYGDGDPVWYGFTNWKGNCYVHALCFQALLQEKGYETQLIWVTNKTHYWNLVKINGVWRHMDATPDRNHRKISIMTDEQRLSTLSGRTWDKSKWPAAE